MMIWVVRNGTADTDSCLLFHKKSDALKWLKSKGLIKDHNFWVRDKGDLTEYDYWLERRTVN